MLKVLPLTSLNGDTDYISSKSSDMSSLYYLMLSPCRSSMGARVSDRIKPDLLLDESGCEADMLEGAEVGRHSPPRPQQEPINLKNERYIRCSTSGARVATNINLGRRSRGQGYPRRTDVIDQSRLSGSRRDWW
ncbi:unnamed protein product [Arctia plantaginis]|uniref:Uncharacterized protein n=1 Tax=Arctia plantaginis TaxID=874455 RepID=A0A8S0ZT55_ARCPL|nr:unnamed protein product [Arctia plantaginis]